MKVKNVFRVIFSLAVFAVFAIAQNEKPLRVDTNLVNVNISVVDAEGAHVPGLRSDQFEVYDNGLRQEITHFSKDDAPISFGIVYDMHPTTEERTKAVLESLGQFTQGLRKQDDFFTIVFNKRGSLILDFVPTAEQVRIHLAGKYREPNSLYDALYKGIEKIRGRSNLKRVLIVITDSADHNSEHRFGEVLDQFKTLDAQVYTVLWDENDRWNLSDVNQPGLRGRSRSGDASGLDRAAMDELAMRTGGTVRSPTTSRSTELLRIFSEIAFELRMQYALGFSPASEDGQTHILKIRLRGVKNSKKMVLTYRPEYKSPGPG